MFKYLKIAASAVCCIAIFAASTCYGPEPEPEARYGLKPTYVNDLTDVVKQLPPQPLVKPGKIYSYGELLLVSEQYKGIHVFDNSDPSAPQKLYFISILGNVDVAIKNGVLYGDQYNNLVSIKLSSIGSDSLEVTRQNSAFQGIHYFDHEVYEPAESEVFYECPDPSLGKVVSWEWDSVYYPCYKN